MSGTSEASDHDDVAKDAEENAAGNVFEENKEPPESPLLDVPDETDRLEEDMPWLPVVAKLLNSFNFYCTHQGFCHPNCYRRQMRAAHRIMEATRHIYGDEIEYADDFPDHQQMIRRPSKRSKYGKPSGDSNSASPDHKRECAVKERGSGQGSASGDPERGGSGSAAASGTGGSIAGIDDGLTLPPAMSITDVGGGVGNVAAKLRRRPKKEEKRSKAAGPSHFTPVLKYMKVRVRSLFHVPLSILNKSACILQDDSLVDVLPVAWELLL